MYFLGAFLSGGRRATKTMVDYKGGIRMEFGLGTAVVKVLGVKFELGLKAGATED